MNIKLLSKLIKINSISVSNRQFDKLYKDIFKQLRLNNSSEIFSYLKLSKFTLDFLKKSNNVVLNLSHDNKTKLSALVEEFDIFKFNHDILNINLYFNYKNKKIIISSGSDIEIDQDLVEEFITDSKIIVDASDFIKSCNINIKILDEKIINIKKEINEENIALKLATQIMKKFILI